MKAFACLAIGIMLVALMTGLFLTGSMVANAATQTCDVPGGYATIQDAVNSPDCDLINLGSGTFTENVVINRTVTIQGQGPADSVVDGDGSGSVFAIKALSEMSQSMAITVTLQGLNIVNGESGIFNEAYNANLSTMVSARLHVEVIDCSISGNSNSGINNSAHDYTVTEVHVVTSLVSDNKGPGITNIAGIFGSATLTVVDSTISGNSGPGIVNHDGIRFSSSKLDMTGSTISGNSGSGIDNVGEANVTNSTISGNSAEKGGGVYSCGSTHLNNSTISGNSADSGGGIFIQGDVWPYGCSGSVRATQTIVANSQSGGECVLYIDDTDWPATFIDGGYNIIEDGTCISAPSSSSGDPLLGLLADNGGPTQTHPLLPGSPAIDAGDNASCPDTDQRGYPRPIDGDKDGTAECDIGSYEFILFSDHLALPLVRR